MTLRRDWRCLAAAVAIAALLVVVVMSCSAPPPTATPDVQATVDAAVAEALAAQGGSEPDGTHNPVPVGSTPTPATTATLTPTPTPEPRIRVEVDCAGGVVRWTDTGASQYRVFIYYRWPDRSGGLYDGSITGSNGSFLYTTQYALDRLPEADHPWVVNATVKADGHEAEGRAECAPGPKGGMPSICDAPLPDGRTAPGCPTPTPTATATPRPTWTPTPTPVTTPIVATERAWDCYYEWECGWEGDHATFWLGTREAWYYKRGPINPVIVKGDPGAVWLEPLEEALQEVGERTGIEYIMWTEGRDPAWEKYALAFHFLPTRDTPVPCEHLPGHTTYWGCVEYTYIENADNGLSLGGEQGNRYAYGGRVWIAALELGRTAAERLDILMHELLHIYGFGHTDGSSIMYPGRIRGNGLTAQDREMLALYKALPNNRSHQDVLKRACIGSDGVCERMYESTPTTTSTTRPTATPRPTPTPRPEGESIVATERAWDCFFAAECGWPTSGSRFYKRPEVVRVSSIQEWSAEFSREWSIASATAGPWLEPLLGVDFHSTNFTLRDHIVFEYLPASSIPCPGGAGPVYVVACANNGANTTYVEGGHIYGGHIHIAEQARVSRDQRARLLAHEILHVFGFVDTDYGIMGPSGQWATQVDLENFALYRALPTDTSIAELRERACIGRNGVCERPYEGG